MPLLDRSATRVELDAADHIFRCDHVHALGDAKIFAHVDRPLTDVVRVLWVAVTDQLTPRAPTTPGRAARECANGADELMRRVGFPVRRFTTAGHHHARSNALSAGARFNRGRQVHGQRDRTQYPPRVAGQANELPKICLAHQIDDAIQSWMPMIGFATLDELDAATKVINHFLVALRVPPLRREIMFAARNDDPEALRDTNVVEDARHRLFFIGQIHIAMEPGDGNGDAQLLFQVLGISMDKVVGTLVALMYQRVMHVQRLNARVALLQRRDVRIVLPNRIGRGTHIGLKPTRTSGMQITNRRRQHENIAGTLKRSKYQSSHGIAPSHSEDWENNLRMPSTFEPGHRP